MLKHWHFVSDFALYVGVKHRKLTECVLVAHVDPVPAEANPAVDSFNGFNAGHCSMCCLKRKLRDPPHTQSASCEHNTTGDTD